MQKTVEMPVEQIANIKEVIDSVEQSGFTDIKAVIDGFEDPIHFVGKGDSMDIVPQITAVKNTTQAYFEVAEKSDDERELVNKWLLLSKIAGMKDGIFRIFVPRGNMRFTRDLVKAYNIQAEIVRL